MTQKPTQGQPPYTPTQLAERWEVDPAVVERLCRSGKIRSSREGRSYRISVEWVEEYEKRQTSASLLTPGP